MLHLLVVGDFFLDNYLSIDPALSETSLETGLEAYQVVEIRHSPGAAGTVVSNLRAMDVAVLAVGVIGCDGAGFDLRQDLHRLGVTTAGLIESPERFTPTYTKPMRRTGPGRAEQELNRLDIKNRRPLPPDLEAAVINRLEALVPTVNGVIIADQVPERNCGVITDGVRAALARLAAANPDTPFVADSRVRIGEFARIGLKPNIHEAQAALTAAGQATISGADDIATGRACGLALFEKNHRPVFITLGANGIMAVSEAGVVHVPGIPVSGPIDVVGAGDSVMAGLAAALSAGARPAEAAVVGNLAASVTIQQLGTTGTASRAQLQERLAQNFPSFGVCVKTAHTTHYPDPLRFKQGDGLTVGRRDTQYDGWVWTTTVTGHSGWAPEQLLSIEGSQAIAQSDYNATELNTRPGERLIVLAELNGWYWVQNERGQKGWVPVETVSV